MKDPTTTPATPWHFGRSDIATLQQSRAYDLVMRLPLLAWSVLCTMAWINGLMRYVSEADPALPNAVYAINIAMRLSAIAFLVLLAASVILRGRPSGRARGLEPRISALLGTLVVYSFSLFPRHDLSATLQQQTQDL